MLIGSETTGDKFRGQKGNSPDRQLRSPSTSSVSYTHLDVYKRQALYTPPVTPRKFVIPETGGLTARRQPSKVGPMIGVKS